MSTQSQVTDLSELRHAFLRESLSIMVRNHGPEDIVHTLATVMDDYAMRYAQRTGDYQGATEMSLIADYLERLDDYLENYDGAPLE